MSVIYYRNMSRPYVSRPNGYCMCGLTTEKTAKMKISFLNIHTSSNVCLKVSTRYNISLDSSYPDITIN